MKPILELLKRFSRLCIIASSHLSICDFLEFFLFHVLPCDEQNLVLLNLDVPVVVCAAKHGRIGEWPEVLLIAGASLNRDIHWLR